MNSPRGPAPSAIFPFSAEKSRLRGLEGTDARLGSQLCGASPGRNLGLLTPGPGSSHLGRIGPSAVKTEVSLGLAPGQSTGSARRRSAGPRAQRGQACGVCTSHPGPEKGGAGLAARPATRHCDYASWTASQRHRPTGPTSPVGANVPGAGARPKEGPQTARRERQAGMEAVEDMGAQRLDDRPGCPELAGAQLGREPAAGQQRTADRHGPVLGASAARRKWRSRGRRARVWRDGGRCIHQAPGTVPGQTCRPGRCPRNVSSQLKPTQLLVPSPPWG